MFFESGNIRLYYERLGEGPALILLHGNGENCRIFDEAAQLLKERYTVYLLDTRGHGQSMPAEHLHYQDMAEDLYLFITELGIEKPAIYGFSDGGIIALLLASQHPEVPGRIIASGVNANPRGIKPFWLTLFRLMHFFRPDEATAMMLREPDITPADLARITVPVTVLGGQKDMIRRRHMQDIARNIPGGRYVELPGETHGSYVVHSQKIARILLQEE